MEFTKFLAFHVFHDFHHHVPDLGLVQNFLPRIFQKFSLSESESSCKIVVLDKNKLKMTDRISSTDQKGKKIAQKKSAQILANMAPTTIEEYYFPSLLLKNRLYKQLSKSAFKKPSLQATFQACF